MFLECNFRQTGGRDISRGQEGVNGPGALSFRGPHKVMKSILGNVIKQG